MMHFTAAAASSVRHLTQVDLARRWRMSERTLEAWRWKKVGPIYLRIGGKIVYALEGILTYEQKHRREAIR